jgi:hypothetical protein
VDAQGDDLLVVRPVEDADAAAGRQRPGGAPEVVVVELLGRRFPERPDVDALRVHAGHHVLDRGVLAGGVDRLEDDEHGVPARRPQQRLRVPQLLDARREPLACGGPQLGVGEARELVAAGPGRVAVVEVGGRAGVDAQLVRDPPAALLAHRAGGGLRVGHARRSSGAVPRRILRRG